MRSIETMQQQVHLAKEIGKRLWLAAEDRLLLQQFPVCDRLHLLAEVIECLDQETASAGSRIENRLAEARVGHFHHEAHDGPWRVEFARVSGRVAHLTQHGFIEGTER